MSEQPESVKRMLAWSDEKLLSLHEHLRVLSRQGRMAHYPDKPMTAEEIRDGLRTVVLPTERDMEHAAAVAERLGFADTPDVSPTTTQSGSAATEEKP